MKVILTRETSVDGTIYPAGTELEVNENAGRFLIRLHRADEVPEENARISSRTSTGAKKAGKKKREG